MRKLTITENSNGSYKIELSDTGGDIGGKEVVEVYQNDTKYATLQDQDSFELSSPKCTEIVINHHSIFLKEIM